MKNTMTMIKFCNCEHKFQDQRYGIGQRVHNEAPKGKAGKWRCTVCNKEKA